MDLPRGSRAAMLVLAVVSSLWLGGCPTAAELENPERFKPPFPDASNVPAGCEQPLPDLSQFSCDVPAVMQMYCSRGGCHNQGTAASGLDLTMNEGLIARVLNVPAKHEGSSCPGNVDCVASMATCDRCDACPDGALLIDRETPAESWVLKKMEPLIPGTSTSNENMGCGESMPALFSSLTKSYDAADKQCLTEFFLEIAMNTPFPERFPCTADPDGGTDGGTDGGI